MTKPVEVSWYYHGPDNETHGPYHAKDMTMWTQVGYFKESLLIRTENEERFHTLGEWTRLCNGKLPYSLPIMSMEHLLLNMGQQTQNQMNPMMMVPPGLPPPFPPPVNRYPPTAFMGLPVHPMATSQPPSEPTDAGSLSHTPDSERDMNLLHQQQQQAQVQYMNGGQGDMNAYQHHNMHQQQQPPVNHSLRHASVMTCAAPVPQLKSIGCGTEKVVGKDVACQTLPVVINSKDAARILSELVGMPVRVT